jgi:predicted transcriptional regulator of viral defense system
VPPAHVRVRFHRLVHSGHIFSPARGLWVAVPPEFRSWGTLPGLQFLDALMTHLGKKYYVGWLSAAEIHGAAHQRPQVLQVAVDAHVADRDNSRVRLRFAQRRRLAHVPRIAHNVVTGQVWVATPELTALDLADDSRLGAGLSNVATVLGELAEDERLNAGALATTAAFFPLATVRRLGYLLDFLGHNDLAASLHPLAQHRRSFPADLLAERDDHHGPINSRWRLVLNADVEPEL